MRRASGPPPPGRQWVARAIPPACPDPVEPARAATHPPGPATAVQGQLELAFTGVHTVTLLVPGPAHTLQCEHLQRPAVPAVTGGMGAVPGQGHPQSALVLLRLPWFVCLPGEHEAAPLALLRAPAPRRRPIYERRTYVLIHHSRTSVRCQEGNWLAAPRFAASAGSRNRVHHGSYLPARCGPPEVGSQRPPTTRRRPRPGLSLWPHARLFVSRPT
jgi:hypothetical protein